MKKFIFIIFICISTFHTPFSLADDLSKQLPLIGQGEYRWFFLSIYDAKLWGKKEENIYSTPLILELIYKRNFKGHDIVNQTEKELRSAGIEENNLNKWKPRLLEIFPNIQPGDSITASFDPEKGIIFYFNKTKEIGKIQDVAFSKTFLDIWLGERSSDLKLRNKLLGRSL
jgi:hypothetical protein